MASDGTRPLSELAAHVGGTLDGDGSLRIRGLTGLEEAGPGELSFYGNARYRQALEATRASAVLVGADAPPRREGVTYVRVEQPHLAYARLLQLFHPRGRPAAGVRPGAHVHPEATVHPEAAVLGGATVEKGARVGARAVLYPGVYLGEGASVGEDSVLYPNVTVRERCIVGARVILHPSVVVGADGFGFALDLEKPEHVKIPQVGIVRIEDEVEVGACSCIDRATTGETVIGRGAKLDNLVQVAHNVVVGPLSLVCAQVGISGSATLGQGVVLAGQVGVVGHLHIGDMAKVGAQSGVAHDVEPGAVLSGSPAIPHREWLRASAAGPRLPEALKELRRLEARLAALEAALANEKEKAKP